MTEAVWAVFTLGWGLELDDWSCLGCLYIGSGLELDD